MPKHSERAHAQWSGSATERNWLCPGNLALIQDVVKVPESKAAAWGTACHQAAEKLLDGKPVEIGDVIETGRHVFYVDQEMLDCAKVYVGYIEKRVNDDGFDLYAVEQRFSLDSMQLGMEADGNADCVLYNVTEEEVEILDLKTGKGKFVDARNNPQERFYGLGVLLGMDLDPTPVRTVKTTIVQPRYFHPDGPIRSETLTVVEILDWTIELAARVRTSAAALKGYADARNSQVKLEAWTDLYLHPGEVQCTFCAAAGSCPALRRSAMEIAGAYEDDSGVHFKSNRFAENTPQGVEADLDMLEQLEAWIRERKALAHEMANQGHRFDHWHLVEKIGHRKFVLKDEALVAEIRKRMPIADEQIYDNRLKSPAGLERSVGKAAVEFFLSDLIERPVIGTDLIRSTHTSREAVGSLVDRFFIDPVEPDGDIDGAGK